MPDGDVFLRTADRIGCRLCRDAVWGHDRCGWMGWSMEFARGQWAPAWRAMGPMLYDGTAGIGLFLAQLSTLTGDLVTEETARGALRQTLTAADTLAGSGQYGFYAGLAGIAYCATEGGALLHDAAIVAGGKDALLRAARLPPQPEQMDVINGSAGLIPLLIDAATGPERDELLAAAIRHADHLVALAHRSDEGWSWNTLGGNGRNLLGYSHGAAGIACALAAVGHAADRADLLDAAREALRYEQAWFIPEKSNWPDLREFSGAPAGQEPPCMTAWCHGAPGIGIGRLLLLDLLPNNASVAADVEAAIVGTAASVSQTGAPGIGSYCLCHGEFGNAELLLLAAERLGRPALREQARQAGLTAIERFEQPGLPWPCGVPGAGETPNLLLGLAGIGYFLLRLHDNAIPSVLSLPLRGRARRVSPAQDG